MKVYRFLIPFFIALCMVSVGTYAQQKRNFTQEADEAFENQQYYTAIDKYKKAYSKVKSNQAEKKRILFQIGECYRLTNNPKRAETQYKRLLRINYQKTNPLTLLYYADALKLNENYAEAKDQYQAYANLVPNDPRGALGVESCELAVKWLENPTRYVVTNEKKFNSRSDDFAPSFADKKYRSLIFTSSREGSTGNKIDDWTGQNFSDLYFSQQDRKGDWSAPVLLDQEGIVNSEANEGAATFSGNFNVLYFTRCGVDRKRQMGCQIYETRRKGRGWDEPKLVAIDIDSNATYGHPAISEDELTLYFAAELPGGYGGKDIYVVKRDRKSRGFGKPRNLGPKVNSVGDDMFPTLRSDTVLYFSSNGHPGMGGLDIFRVAKVGDEWGTPVNMKVPVNSNGDDFHMVFFEGEERGFMTSNRKESRGGDDIFSFYERPLLFTISGRVRDDRTLQFLQGVKVAMTGSDGTSIEALTDNRGYYSFDNKQVLKHTSYELNVSLKDYFGASAKETTVGLLESKDFTIDFILVPIPEKPILLPEILYDLAKWDLKPQYQDSLIGLIQILEANPTLVIELASHTDARDTDERNDILSQRRAQSVVDYLIVRGIHPGRLVAKGYGERVPRVIEKNIERAGFTFREGTVLTESYINSLPSNAIREAAHQMNRRTEFRVLRKDFVPTPIAADSTEQFINIVLNPDENIVPIVSNADGSFTASCILNNYKNDFYFDIKTQTLNVSLEFALKLLLDGAISKDDFLGDVITALAGGTIADQSRFRVKSLRIGDNTITNLEATVLHALPYSVSIGKPILDRFGSYTIDKDNNQLIFK